jgi:ATP-dependent helicase HrpB
MVGERGVSFFAPQDSSTSLFVVVDADAGQRGAASSGRIRTASEITYNDLAAEHPALLSTRTRAVFNPKTESVATWEETLFADLVIAEKPAKEADLVSCAAALAEIAQLRFTGVFSPNKEAAALIDRIRFAVRFFPEKPLPDVSEKGLAALLADLCIGMRSLDEVRRIDWYKTIHHRLEYSTLTWLDRAVPAGIVVPSGSEIKIIYSTADKADGAPPHIACRMQELFGLMDTPRIGEGRIGLVIHLLAPNMRPCQVTQDLQSFWKNTYPEVRKELKGRYPKHYWPEDPYAAEPTARVRRRKTD